jgi:UDP-hydrolysing UDP-N-acetyl-D-glucosamine 2-epimerase
VATSYLFAQWCGFGGVRITILSTSRADIGSLMPVATELKARENTETRFIRWDPGYNYRPLDIAVILGDRNETLQLAFELNLNRVPIAHLSGGDVTEGSQDDCFRHAITKLSHLHFPTNQKACDRILQMGEEPWRVHMVGSPSADSLLTFTYFTQMDALRCLDLSVKDFVLICLHPNTFGKTDDELLALRNYIEKLPKEMGKVFIGPNLDEGGEIIDMCFATWAGTFPNSAYRQEVSRHLYLSLMLHCKEMVGNSSAMLYEAPTLGTKTVFIGDRQGGRDPVYSDGKAAERVAYVLSKIQVPTDYLLRKKFIDLDYGGSLKRTA